MARPSLSTELKQMILRVARGIQSDYDRSQVLTAYVQKFGVEPQARDGFFQGCRRDSVGLRAPAGADRSGEEGPAERRGPALRRSSSSG